MLATTAIVVPFLVLCVWVMSETAPFSLYCVPPAVLRVLNLSHNNIGAKGLTHLALALYENKTLAQLDISHNPITEQGSRRQRQLARQCVGQLDCVVVFGRGVPCDFLMGDLSIGTDAQLRLIPIFSQIRLVFFVIIIDWIVQTSSYL